MFARIADKARDFSYMNPCIHIAGNKEIIIENCIRIEEYNEVFMRLISSRLCIQIWGRSLKAYDFKTNDLVIRGIISQIEFTERKGRHNA